MDPGYDSDYPLPLTLHLKPETLYPVFISKPLYAGFLVHLENGLDNLRIGQGHHIADIRMI